ncbi:MAG: TetR family transcriptional regulator [Dehalococcoidia bacterium]|nr:MAG: TetR family transcriptional regulator [Dehalococcoidia bacterium]
MQQVRARARRDSILEAALRVFARAGYHLASVDAIAREANTSKGGVYFHFPSKETIFLLLLDRAASQLRARAEAAIAAERDPVAKVEAALWTVLDAFSAHRDLARLFLVEGAAAGQRIRERIDALHAEFTQLIRDQLDAAVAAGAIPPIDTALVAQAWFGALNEVVTGWAHADQPSSLPEAFWTLRRLFLRGVGIDPDFGVEPA